MFLFCFPEIPLERLIFSQLPFRPMENLNLFFYQPYRCEIYVFYNPLLNKNKTQTIHAQTANMTLNLRLIMSTHVMGDFKWFHSQMPHARNCWLIMQRPSKASANIFKTKLLSSSGIQRFKKGLKYKRFEDSKMVTHIKFQGCASRSIDTELTTATAYEIGIVAYILWYFRSGPG